ncbi:MAG: transcriptional regulator with XRE-family HTH domain [Candidatus Aldehydirespiratoraceae bacterium]|jgi:transcriptional regulator with XRE-family HTH domain
MDLRSLSDSQVMTELRQRAKTARLRRNVSQAALAERTGLGIHTVRRFEAGESDPSLATFISIVRELNDINSLDRILEEPPIDPISPPRTSGQRQRSSRARPATPDVWEWGDER